MALRSGQFDAGHDKQRLSGSRSQRSIDIVDFVVVRDRDETEALGQGSVNDRWWRHRGVFYVV
jgi:hypothetical protein